MGKRKVFSKSFARTTNHPYIKRKTYLIHKNYFWMNHRPKQTSENYKLLELSVGNYLYEFKKAKIS